MYDAKRIYIDDGFSYAWLRRLNTIYRQPKVIKVAIRITGMRLGQLSIPSTRGATVDVVLNTIVSFGFMFLPIYFVLISVW